MELRLTGLLPCCPLFCILTLTTLSHIVYALLSPPGSPGVCGVTEEVEVLHNVTVYSPCIRRLEAPCGGAKMTGKLTRMCTVYSQQTCSRVSSRLKVENVTRYLCCEGWHEDTRGYCTLDIFPLSISYEDATVYKTHPPTDAQTTPQSIYEEITTTTTIDEPTTSPYIEPKNSPKTQLPTTIQETTSIQTESTTTDKPTDKPLVQTDGSPPGIIPDPLSDYFYPDGYTTMGFPSSEPTTPLPGSVTTTPATTTQITTTVEAMTTLKPSTEASSTPAVKLSVTMSQTTTVTSLWWPLFTSTTVPARFHTTLQSTLAPLLDEDKTKMKYEYVTVKAIMKDSSVQNNSSLFVHQSSVGIGLSPAVIVAVIIAVIVLLVTAIGCIYIFLFKDKPRTAPRVTRDVRLNNFYLSDCNGSAQPSVSVNSDRALPVPGSENGDESKTETLPNGSTSGKPMCNGTPKVKKAEPPLTTSTPISRVSEKSGFAYMNPGFKVEGSDGSLSDVSEIGFPSNAPATGKQNGKVTNYTKFNEEDEKNGGYMIPISKRDTAESPKQKKSKTLSDIMNLKSANRQSEDGTEASSSLDEPDADCVSENMENERRHEDLSSIHGGVYESIPADHDHDRDNNQESDLKLSSDAHTYEEIPGNLIKPGTSGESSDHVRMDSDPLGEAPASVSEDLVTFMTNYLANKGSFVDLDVTYDQPDMYTPATPTDDESENHEKPNESNQLAESSDASKSTSGATYGTLQKTPKSEVVKDVAPEVSKSDFARASSFENIYDTVDPETLTGGSEETIEEIGQEEKASETPLLPPRRRVLESPVMPELDIGEEYSVIDLSDEMANDSVFIHDENSEHIASNCEQLEGVQIEQLPPPPPNLLEDSHDGQNMNLDCSYVTLGPAETTDNCEDGNQAESLSNTNSRKHLAGSSKDYGESDA